MWHDVQLQLTFPAADEDAALGGENCSVSHQFDSRCHEAELTPGPCNNQVSSNQKLQKMNAKSTKNLNQVLSHWDLPEFGVILFKDKICLYIFFKINKNMKLRAP